MKRGTHSSHWAAALGARKRGTPGTRKFGLLPSAHAVQHPYIPVFISCGGKSRAPRFPIYPLGSEHGNYAGTRKSRLPFCGEENKLISIIFSPA